MLGMLNSRPVPNDSLAAAARNKTKVTAAAGATRRAPAPAYVTPPMYKPPQPPIAVPGVPATATTTATPPPAAVTNKLEQWRQARAQRMAGGAGANAVVATPMTPVMTMPPTPMMTPTPAVTSAAPTPTPMVDLTKLREELVSLVQTQAPKLDLDLKLLPFNQRLQDLDLRLNNTKLLLEEMNLSLNAIQLQSSQDRRLLLNGITADDFKGLHEDLSAALHEYFVEFEETLQKLLQEFNDRIYCVYAVTVTETPQLHGPSFGGDTGATAGAPTLPKIPAGTRVKVCYPQQQTAEGIFIRCLAVDPQTGQITLNWIPVQDHNTQQSYLGQFSV